jgi:DNA-binding MarR family transcriptional regulator
MPVRNRNLKKIEKRNPNFYGFMIYKEISTRSDLTSSQKLVLSYILSMLISNERFYSTNETIMNICGITQKTCSNTITLLKKRCLIKELPDKRMRNIIATGDLLILVKKYERKPNELI